MQQPAAVSLVVLTPNHPWRDQVLALDPGPGREIFSGRVARTLPAAEADPHRTPFVIAAAATPPIPVGFGVLDRVGILAELVDQPSRAVLLRGFFVDLAQQGRGFGTAAARQVRELAAELHGDAELVVLTVNQTNLAGVSAYRRAGFVDTGTLYLGGPNGPQQVMVTSVPRRARLARAAPGRS